MPANSVLPRIPVSAEIAQEMQETIPAGASLALRDAQGHEVELPSAVEQVLLKALDAMRQQGAVTITQTPDELTTTMAAELLGISRPTLLKWVSEGRIQSHKVGTHTRFSRADVLELREEREREQRQAFADLRKLDAGTDFAFFAD